MKKTGDIIIDEILGRFLVNVRNHEISGLEVNFEECLESAMSCAPFFLKKDHKISENEIREHIWAEEDNIREKCRKALIQREKRGKLLEIRKTSIAAVLDDFEKRTGLDMVYKLRDNNSVGFCVKLQPKQYIKFGVSYSKVLTPGWLDGMEKDLKELIEISSRLGRMTISSAGK